ncbi:MAG TPA: ABC transporter ATP-binding protein [Chitinophagaceae bacterium]
MQPLLEIKNLSVDFITENETTNAVKNISLLVNRGELLAIVGESGSGKSVTSLSVLRLLPSPPASYPSGEIIFTEENSIDLLKLRSKELQSIRGNKIAMIFQEPMSSLNPVMSCGKQIVEAIQQHRDVSFIEAKKQTIEWFEKVKLPDPGKIFDRYPHQLSGGQKQRVMIAMAMCCHPSLLICDEPTTALDVTVQKTILELIKDLQKEHNIGVIFITHDLGVVAEIADRVAIMYKGEIIEQGIASDIFRNPGHPYTKALLACRPALHPKGERLPIVSDFLEEKTTSVHKQDEPAPTQISNKILAEVKNLSVHFPGKKNFFGKPLGYTKAVDDVSLPIFEGETLGLVGESGCGKTTLGRTLLRLIEPTAGKIIINGVDITELHSKQLMELRKDVQLVFQDPFSSLNPRLTIGDAIAEPMYKVKGDNRKLAKRKVLELLDKVNLPAHYADRYPHEFSGGQRQRIVIARALSLSPDLLVCDESVSALDVSVQAQVLNLLNDLKKELGLTMLFISHDLSVVRYMSNRIAVMKAGKIVELGDAEQVYYHPKESYTKSLIASIPQVKV